MILTQAEAAIIRTGLLCLVEDHHYTAAGPIAEKLQAAHEAGYRLRLVPPRKTKPARRPTA